MNANGSTPVNLTPTLTATNDRWSAWSPEGNKIVFWSGIGNGLGTDAEIYTFTTDGSATLINLTRNDAGEAEPDWGPAPVTNRRCTRSAARAVSVGAPLCTSARQMTASSRFAGRSVRGHVKCSRTLTAHESQSGLS